MPGMDSIHFPVYKCAVVMGNKIYIRGEANKLFVVTLNATLNSGSWTVSTTPTSIYALTTYHSRLVLVGGLDTSTLKVTNKLWVSDEGVDWDTSLPPMPTRRALSSAINTGSPQYLVVAGGRVGVRVETDVVEVFAHEQWSTVQPLPYPCYGMSSTLHNGSWYLIDDSSMFCCKLAELLAPCIKTSTEIDETWFLVDDSQKIFYQGSCRTNFQPALISFGQRLVAFSHNGTHAYSNYTESWVHVHEIADATEKFPIVLPTGALIMISKRLRDYVKITLKGIYIMISVIYTQMHIVWL